MLSSISKGIKLTVVLAIVSSGSILQAQEANHAALSKTLQAKDSLLFTVGFNECKLQQLELLIHQDFEFYHDRGGITETKDAFLATIKNNICGSGKSTTTRKLDKSSLTVFPLYRGAELYGAVQTGIHQFNDTVAKFTHVWLLEDNEWKLSRVLSYDHQIL